MFLTDSTEVRLIAGGSRIAVAEFLRPATLLRTDAPNVFVCGWAYETFIPDYDGGHNGVVECKALAVGFDNGFKCATGHSHHTDAEYFDADEIAGMRDAHLPLPANARTMKGTPIQ